ncbi:MAG: hypothetical protein GAK35_03984 [Herbaspirillum frisingense]|uniref:FeoB-associated Cys-rich membrane protein n=1 Tax=Herbaspirillum frisingense TaxID=92645 RepID=A0A7V8JSP6_9BURK|nr:MAG: hypothetical protein GAK35_03984 [Herbaspirillum frisingense]
MSALWWQYAIVAVLVAASVLYMVRKLAPAATWRWQALGRRLLPPVASGGCGGGACDGCGDAGDAQPPLEQKISFHRRR